MRLKKSYFLMISILGLVAIFSSTMSKSPILPLFAMSLITSPHEVQFIGYVIAASTIPGIIVSAFAGRLSDMYGREKLVLLSVVIFASAPFFYLLATNIWILMLVRFYHGFSTAVFVPVATSAIAELYPKQKGEKISLFSSITLIGRFFAPITGGFILYVTNYYYYGVYLVCGFSGIIAFFFAIFYYKTRKSRYTQTDISKRELFTIKEFLRGLKDVISHKKIMIISIIQASQYFAYGIIEAYFILYISSLNYEAWLIGLMPAFLTFTIIVAKPFMGNLSDRIGRKHVILGGLLIGGFVTLFIPHTVNLILLIVIFISFGIGMASVTSSTPAYITDLLEKENYGSAIGVLSTIMDIGQTIGPIISGYILMFFSYQGIFLLTGFTLLFAALLFFISFFLLKKKHLNELILK